MGKTMTPTYRLEVKDRSGNWRQGWRGRATDRGLESYMVKYTDSLKVGGCNHHLCSGGVMPIPNSAKIVNQKTGEVVATWKAPLFWVV